MTLAQRFAWWWEKLGRLQVRKASAMAVTDKICKHNDWEALCESCIAEQRAKMLASTCVCGHDRHDGRRCQEIVSFKCNQHHLVSVVCECDLDLTTREKASGVDMASADDTLVIPMTDARPVRIVFRDWPIIASKGEFQGPFITVRRHSDGRVLVYGSNPKPVAAFPHYGEVILPEGRDEAAMDDAIREALKAAGTMLGQPVLAYQCLATLEPKDLT